MQRFGVTAKVRWELRLDSSGTSKREHLSQQLKLRVLPEFLQDQTLLWFQPPNLTLAEGYFSKPKGAQGWDDPWYLLLGNVP